MRQQFFGRLIGIFFCRAPTRCLVMISNKIKIFKRLATKPKFLSSGHWPSASKIIAETHFKKTILYLKKKIYIKKSIFLHKIPSQLKALHVPLLCQCNPSSMHCIKNPSNKDLHHPRITLKKCVINWIYPPIAQLFTKNSRISFEKI